MESTKSSNNNDTGGFGTRSYDTSSKSDESSSLLISNNENNKDYDKSKKEEGIIIVSATTMGAQSNKYDEESSPTHHHYSSFGTLNHDHDRDRDQQQIQGNDLDHYDDNYDQRMETTSLIAQKFDNDNDNHNNDNNDNDNNDNDKEKGESKLQFTSSTSSTTSSDTDTETNQKLTYYGIVKSNKPFQLYLSSYIISQAGEWYTYVASIELLEEILASRETTTDIPSPSPRIYVSYLVVCRLLPFLVISPFGGVLADIRDRRHSMIVLDFIAATIPLLFLLAAHYMSIPMIFVITSMQSTIAALYEPCRNAIIPLLVPDAEEMKIATTLAGLAWAVMAAVGAALGGIMVSLIGVRACFVIDAITFIISALILVMMGGKWDASTINYTTTISSPSPTNPSLTSRTTTITTTTTTTSTVTPATATTTSDLANTDTNNNTNTNKTYQSPIQLIQDMIVGGAVYISSSNFWPFVFIKLTASIIYGGADVLNVAFSEDGYQQHEHGHDEGSSRGNSIRISDDEEAAANSRRLGALFFCVGFGCLIGPLIADNWTSMKRMYSIMNACVIAFAIQAIGCLGMGYFKSFILICFFTMVRSAGSSIAWIDSSLLLQTYSKPDMLGRVTSVDYALALTGEALSAMLVGVLQDKYDMSAMEVSRVMGYAAVVLVLVWMAYRIHKPHLEELI